MPLNPFALVGHADPYPLFAAARREEPLSQIPGIGLWSALRYEDCVSILRRPEIFSSDGMTYGPALLDASRQRAGDLPPSMLGQDPPQHTRLRGLVSRAFTPRMVAQLEPRMRQVTDELLAPALANGRVDVIHDLAYPLPVVMIAEILGVPPEDRGDFKRWSDAIVASLGGGQALPGPVAAEAEQAQAEFIEYFSRIFALRRAAPRDDLVSNLLKLEDEGDPLSPDELLSMCILLLVAGNETTTNLIGNAMLALTRFPESLARLRAEPALIPSAVEEVLRFYPPVQATVRFTREAVEIAGQTIPERNAVVVWLAAANRDETLFPEPDTFDITREPNRHLSFGLGVHFCLGAPLARLEARVALEEMLTRLPNFRLVDDAPLERINSFIFHGVKQLPLAFDALATATR